MLPDASAMAPSMLMTMPSSARAKGIRNSRHKITAPIDRGIVLRRRGRKKVLGVVKAWKVLPKCHKNKQKNKVTRFDRGPKNGSLPRSRTNLEPNIGQLNMHEKE